MVIRTTRLLLRPIAPQDADGYAHLLADPRIHPFVVEDGPVSPDAIPERIARKQQQYAEGTAATWAILRDDVFIGYVAIHGWGKPRVAMSYALRVSDHGFGLGREAVSAVLLHAQQLGFTEVEARTHHGNEASARLLRAAGFVEVEPSTTPPRRVFVWTA